MPVIILFSRFAHEITFNSFRKTWKLKEELSFQKWSWKSWRGRRLRYFALQCHLSVSVILKKKKERNLNENISFLVIFNSWNTEIELQKEGRSMVFLNLLHLKRNFTKHQAQQCKWEEFNLTANSLWKLLVISSPFSHYFYVNWTFLTPVIHHHQKLWAAH